MSLVREHIIFEKFTEDSDPIKDIGIGYPVFKKIWSEERMKVGPEDVTTTYHRYFPKDTSKPEYFKSRVVMIIFYTLINLIDSNSFKEHQGIFNKAIIDSMGTKNFWDEKEMIKKAAYILNTYFHTHINVNEKFTEDNDPIKDLSIGIDKEKYKDDLISALLRITPKSWRYIRKVFKISNPSESLYLLGEIMRSSFRPGFIIIFRAVRKAGMAGHCAGTFI